MIGVGSCVCALFGGYPLRQADSGSAPDTRWCCVTSLRHRSISRVLRRYYAPAVRSFSRRSRDYATKPQLDAPAHCGNAPWSELPRRRLPPCPRRRLTCSITPPGRRRYLRPIPWSDAFAMSTRRRSTSAHPLSAVSASDQVADGRRNVCGRLTLVPALRGQGVINIAQLAAETIGKLIGVGVGYRRVLERLFLLIGKR